MTTRIRTSVYAVPILVAVALFSATARAQDLELEPMFLVLAENEGVVDASASSLQMYRIPIAFTVRSPDDHSWGFKLHLPLSFGAYDLRASTSARDFAERVETITLVPGAEFLLPAGDRWFFKPFAEIGISDATSGGGTETVYSLGLRVRGDHSPGPVLLTTGASARYSSQRSSRALLNDYTSLGLGADVQWPIHRRRTKRELRVGGYAIARFFPGLDVPEPFEKRLDRVYEIGVSFSTDPKIVLAKVKLPWLGLGYRFGDLFHGVRISFSFPF